VDKEYGAGLSDELVELMHRYSLAAQQLGATFAQRHRLHPTDLQALIAVMLAERDGDPLTPGRLGEALGLSSGASTAVIDRLEKAGHLRRTRESSDRRVVHLRYGEPGMAIAVSFFRPMGVRSRAVIGQFSPAEQQVIRRYLVGMTDAIQAHHRAVRG
jgi:DNA-binding MarR family transcriptional regulator